MAISCTKEHGEVTEEIPIASISFTLPSQGAVFANGDVVTIQAKAISTQNIHGYDLAIRKTSDTTNSVFFTHIHDHNDTLLINETWKSLVTHPTDLQAEIVLYLDHQGHTKKGKVFFRVE